MMRCNLARLSLLFALLLSLSVPAAAETLRVMGAGSLATSFAELIRSFPAAPDAVAPPEFGPSGLMRQKIESGAAADLFASADMEQARRLATGRPERMVINFTRNRLCAFAREAVGLTSANILDRILDPSVRIATSTPGADPAGDYAMAVFDRADAARAGAGATLRAKALHLFGGGDATPLLAPGKGAVAGIFAAGRADVTLAYCSGAAEVAHEEPGLAVVPLPPALSVVAAYGMVLLNEKPLTLRFAAFVMSEGGQAILKSNGFDPTALVEPVGASQGLLVQRAGKPSQILSAARIAALKPFTQRVGSFTGLSGQQNEFSGPLLWDVLVAAEVVEAGAPRSEARFAVRVTGADGYTAVVALGEIAPQLANRPIQLADHVNGKPLPSLGLRLVVPGDGAGARSVRDVVRVDID
jgi:molybdate transport system substrate-binding protein